MWLMLMSPLESKKAKAIFLLLLAWTLASLGPGWPFPSQSLLCCLIRELWKDTADISFMTFWSKIAMEGERAIAKKALQILTCAFFISSLRS